MDIDPDDPDAVKLLTRQQAVIASVLSATVRVTANRLRGKEKDMMAEVREAIKAYRANPIAS